MTLLERDEGSLYYDLTDIAPPWARPRETILFLHGLAIDSDIWSPWLPALVDRYRIVREDRCHVSLTLGHRDVDGAPRRAALGGVSQARRALWRTPEHATRAPGA